MQDKKVDKITMFQPSKLTTEVLSFIKRLNLPYTYMAETYGDGNCFFRAIEDQLQNKSIKDSCSARIQGQNWDHKQLRTAVIQFCQFNKKLQEMEGFQVLKTAYIEEKKRIGETSEVTWKRCLWEMSQNGTWAENIFIECTALFLGKDICLTTPSNSNQQPWITVSGKTILL